MFFEGGFGKSRNQKIRKINMPEKGTRCPVLVIGSEIMVITCVARGVRVWVGKSKRHRLLYSLYLYCMGVSDAARRSWTHLLFMDETLINLLLELFVSFYVYTCTFMYVWFGLCVYDCSELNAILYWLLFYYLVTVIVA